MEYLEGGIDSAFVKVVRDDYEVLCLSITKYYKNYFNSLSNIFVDAIVAH